MPCTSTRDYPSNMLHISCQLDGYLLSSWLSCLSWVSVIIGSLQSVFPSKSKRVSHKHMSSAWLSLTALHSLYSWHVIFACTVPSKDLKLGTQMTRELQNEWLSLFLQTSSVGLPLHSSLWLQFRDSISFLLKKQRSLQSLFFHSIPAATHFYTPSLQNSLKKTA